jgi:hypothetical protein
MKKFRTFRTVGCSTYIALNHLLFDIELVIRENVCAYFVFISFLALLLQDLAYLLVNQFRMLFSVHIGRFFNQIFSVLFQKAATVKNLY